MNLQQQLRFAFSLAMPLIDASLTAELERLRMQIRELDRELIELLAKRLRLCVEVGRHKRPLGLMIRNRQVEAKVHANAREAAVRSGLALDHAEAFMRQIIDLGIAVQAADR